MKNAKIYDRLRIISAMLFIFFLILQLAYSDVDIWRVLSEGFFWANIIFEFIEIVVKKIKKKEKAD